MSDSALLEYDYSSNAEILNQARIRLANQDHLMRERQQLRDSLVLNRE